MNSLCNIATESTTRTISHISFTMKLLGERNARNWHVAFDEAGAGDVNNAPALDPTVVLSCPVTWVTGELSIISMAMDSTPIA